MFSELLLHVQHNTFKPFLFYTSTIQRMIMMMYRINMKSGFSLFWSHGKFLTTDWNQFNNQKCEKKVDNNLNIQLIISCKNDVSNLTPICTDSHANKLMKLRFGNRSGRRKFLISGENLFLGILVFFFFKQKPARRKYLGECIKALTAHPDTNQHFS